MSHSWGIFCLFFTIIVIGPFRSGYKTRLMWPKPYRTQNNTLDCSDITAMVHTCQGLNGWTRTWSKGVRRKLWRDGRMDVSSNRERRGGWRQTLEPGLGWTRHEPQQIYFLRSLLRRSIGARFTCLSLSCGGGGSTDGISGRRQPLISPPQVTTVCSLCHSAGSVTSNHLVPRAQVEHLQPPR